MKEKKSLVAAKARALEMSREFPRVPFRVMDKKGGVAIVNSSDSAYRVRIYDGWVVVATFQNGQEVK